jgi:hypothetical protein
MRSQPLLVLLLAAVALAPVACKRKMDDVIPNSTASATAAATSAAAATASATAADDTSEALAPLSSTKIVAPPPAATPKSDAAAPKAAAPAPQECGAAVLMKKLGKVNEAETLRIKCVEKGGKDPFAK